MATTNLNIRTEKEIKDEAEKIYSELGLTMTAAINLFLRASIRQSGIPFDLTLNRPNAETLSAIEEGRRIAADDAHLAYKTMEELKAALEK